MDGLSLLLAAVVFLAAFGALAFAYGADSRDGHMDERRRPSRG